MPLIQGQVGPQIVSDGVTPTARMGKLGELMVSDVQGRYYEQAYRKNLFLAWAAVTTPVIYSTAAATGGPLIWNGSQTTNVVILAACCAITTAFTTTPGVIGITGNTGQAAAPGSTTAIDGRANCFIGGGASSATPYRLGTVSTAGAFFFPLFQAQLGATSVTQSNVAWIDVGGAIVCPPNSWVSLANGVAAPAAGLMHTGLLYTEVPV